MAWIFLALSIWGALFTLAARFPARRNRLLFVPTFFMSWLTIELAPQHLVIQVVASALFIWGGALELVAGLGSARAVHRVVDRARADGSAGTRSRAARCVPHWPISFPATTRVRGCRYAK